MSQSASTINTFVSLLRKSGLAEESKIDDVVASFDDLDAPMNDEVTQAFIDAELITTWHLKPVSYTHLTLPTILLV